MLTDGRAFLKNYTDLSTPLGHGAYGHVSLWKCCNTEEQRAIKIQRLCDARDVTDWQREERALATAAYSSDPDARHIVHIYASCLTQPVHSICPSGSFAVRFGYLVMACGEMTLSQALDRHKDKPLPEALRWSLHLFRGLTFIHSKGIIHRDLKPSNVLLIKTRFARWDLKIADLGSSREEAQMMTAAVVSLPYRAPEILLGAMTEQAGPQKPVQHSNWTLAHTHTHSTFG
jgi:serine/threonine protein kinase